MTTSYPLPAPDGDWVCPHCGRRAAFASQAGGTVCFDCPATTGKPLDIDHTSGKPLRSQPAALPVGDVPRVTPSPLTGPLDDKARKFLRAVLKRKKTP